MLGEQELAVGVDVEDAAGAADQLDVGLELFLDRVLQTGGSGEVVSSTTVFDGDLHRVLLMDRAEKGRTGG